LHGMALNVAPDLSHFSGIVPCGVNETHYGVTSLADLKVRASMADVDAVLRREFDRLFGPMASQTVGSTEKPPRATRSASAPSR
jgi:lipoyl(octanoyl) transferase